MSEMNDYYVDNHNGTITKKYGDSEVNYNILVGKNIPDDESILDYYHSQFESELKDALENEGIGYDQFCSGTALAMALAIVRGEQDITPKDILYWGENDEIVNWGGNGLKDWERDTGVNEVYDNRHSETDGAHYSSHIGDIANDDEAHLNEIKYILSLGHPVIVHVEGHFVVIVGVVDGVELKDATVGQLVIFDPGANETITNRITTMSDRGYEISDHRIITPYLIDDNKNLVLDENGEPTMDPYYLDPLYYDLEGNVLPEEEGKRRKETKEAIENSVNNTNLPQHEKDRIISELESAYNCKDIAESKAVENENVFGRISSIIKTVIDAVTQASKTSYDPLIFDLDGDGFNIESKENGTNFDLDKNGFAERINWTKKDGFLCLDLNGNGIIDNGGELFGDQTLLADGTKAKNGFEALAQYDSNGDGVIDENDEIFDKLRIWVDANGNGISDEGEMMTLRELGITSINLNYETTNGETGTEATIGNSASFTREDGTTGGIGELWVSADLYDTVDRTDIEIPDEIKKLPDICSIGNVYSLHVAMALDETGELKALVESFAVEQDVDKRMELVEKILYFICGANDVKDGSRGEYMDAKQLAVLEAMLGEKYVGTTGANPHSDAAPMLKEAYKDLLDMYYNELNIQTHIKNYVPLLRYTENEDGSKILNADLLNYILEYKLANGDEDAKNILADIARYVKYLDNGGIEGMYSFAMNYSIISAEYAAVIADIMDNGYVADGENPLTGTSGADFLVGSDNSEIIKGNAGNDILIGGKGDDTLYGGA
ncbi:MAG: hypothetical protein J1F11_05300, partial [Oscillospiraceae bacterium]|nr:hypothetical protein [Oscillospiraceae bacterium]